MEFEKCAIMSGICRSGHIFTPQIIGFPEDALTIYTTLHNRPSSYHQSKDCLDVKHCTLFYTDSG